MGNEQVYPCSHEAFLRVAPAGGTLPGSLLRMRHLPEDDFPERVSSELGPLETVSSQDG